MGIQRRKGREGGRLLWRVFSFSRSGSGELDERRGGEEEEWIFR